MWFLEIFFIVGWLAIIFAKGAWWLHLKRLSMGFASGILTYVSAVYVGEITPNDIQGGFTAAIQVEVYKTNLSLKKIMTMKRGHDKATKFL